MIVDRDEMNEASYTAGWNDGYRQALVNIHRDLEDMTDGAGSLSGGDTVEYIYNLFDVHGITAEETIAIEPPEGVEFDDDNIVGSREALLLLARNIHDTIEGGDREHVSG